MIVDPDHFAYLSLQRGAIQQMVHDKTAWQIAYEQSLKKDYVSIYEYLPSSCSSVVDIGGGLGGIDALLVKKFGTDCEVSILDGYNDEPFVKKHSITFNSMAVAQDFLKKNGVEKFNFYRTNTKIGKPADVILSFASWCFHYPPEVYLDFVKSCFHKDTVLIVDVRTDKDKWAEALDAAFQYSGTALIANKFVRMVFRAR